MSPQEPHPRDRGPQWWLALVRNVQLAWRLLRDPLVPAWLKLIPLGAVLYILLPVDLVPDIVLGFGQLDDLGILLLSLRAFISLCPGEILQRHLAQMSAVDGSYRVVEEETPQRPQVAGHLDVEPYVRADGEPAPDAEQVRQNANGEL